MKEDKTVKTTFLKSLLILTQPKQAACYLKFKPSLPTNKSENVFFQTGWFTALCLCLILPFSQPSIASETRYPEVSKAEKGISKARTTVGKNANPGINEEIVSRNVGSNIPATVIGYSPYSGDNSSRVPVPNVYNRPPKNRSGAQIPGQAANADKLLLSQSFKRQDMGPQTSEKSKPPGIYDLLLRPPKKTREEAVPRKKPTDPRKKRPPTGIKLLSEPVKTERPSLPPLMDAK